MRTIGKRRYPKLHERMALQSIKTAEELRNKMTEKDTLGSMREIIDAGAGVERFGGRYSKTAELIAKHFKCKPEDLFTEVEVKHHTMA